MCGGASIDDAVGCYSFYPGLDATLGNWTERGNHTSSTMP